MWAFFLLKNVQCSIIFHSEKLETNKRFTELFISVKYKAIPMNMNPYLFLSEKSTLQYLWHSIMTIKIFVKLYVSWEIQKVSMSDEDIPAFEIGRKYFHLPSHVLWEVQYFPQYFCEFVTIYVLMLNSDSRWLFFFFPPPLV